MGGLTDTANSVLELIVISGPLKGAKASLPYGKTVSVGYDFGYSLVLRDPAAKGFHLELKCEPTGAVAVLRDGQINFLGQTMTSGAEWLVPFYIPLYIGNTAFAIGMADDARWAEAKGLCALREKAFQGLSPRPDLETPEQSPPKLSWKRPVTVATLLQQGPKAILAVFAGVISVLVTVAFVSPPSTVYAHPHTDIRRILKQSGYERLAVSEISDDNLRIEGRLPRRSDLTKLQNILSQNHIDANLFIKTDEDIEDAIYDLLQSKKITARIEINFPEKFVIILGDNQNIDISSLKKSIESDVYNLDDIEIVKQSDLNKQNTYEENKTNDLKDEKNNKVSKITEKNIADAVKIQNLKFFDNNLLRSVPGNDGYVLTKDKNIYFLGSVLKNNYKIKQIKSNYLVLEKDGVVFQYKI